MKRSVILASLLIISILFAICLAQDDEQNEEAQGAGLSLKATLSGHKSYIRSVAFSPDGSILASGSNDGKIKLWNASSGNELNTLTGHETAVQSVAFSPDSRTLASIDDNHFIKLWDTSTGNEIKTLTLEGQVIKEGDSVAFSPDGRLLATEGCGSERGGACPMGLVILLDISTGAVVKSFKGHTTWIFDVAFSPDGKLLASGAWDHTVRLWDISTGRQLASLSGHATSVATLAFSPDGRILVSGGNDGKVIMWDVPSRRQLAILKGHRDSVNEVAFSPNGRIFASCGCAGRSSGTLACIGGVIKLWDASTKQEVLSQTFPQNSIMSVAFSPDGKLLASGCADKKVRIWEVPAGLR